MTRDFFMQIRAIINLSTYETLQKRIWFGCLETEKKETKLYRNVKLNYKSYINKIKLCRDKK